MGREDDVLSRQHRKRDRNSPSRSPSNIDRKKDRKDRRSRSRERDREKHKSSRKHDRDRHRSSSRDRGDSRSTKSTKELEIIASDKTQKLSTQGENSHESANSKDRDQVKKDEEFELEEEMRKRRERVKAWQEEKAKRLSELNAPVSLTSSLSAGTAFTNQKHDTINQPQDTSKNSKTGDEEAGDVNSILQMLDDVTCDTTEDATPLDAEEDSECEVDGTQDHGKSKRWSLEDDDEEEENGNEDYSSMAIDDGDTEATENSLSYETKFPSFNITAKEVVEDFKEPHFQFPESTSSSSSSSVTKQKSTDAVFDLTFSASKVRKQRFRFSQLGSSTIEDPNNVHKVQVQVQASLPVPESRNTVVDIASSIAASSRDESSSTFKAIITSIPSSAGTSHVQDRFEEVVDDDFDPLDAFMNGLYDTGEVTSQQELKGMIKASSNNGPSSLNKKSSANNLQYLEAKSSSASAAELAASGVDSASEDDDLYTFYSGKGKINAFGSNFITLDELLQRFPNAPTLGWESDAEAMTFGGGGDNENAVSSADEGGAEEVAAIGDGDENADDLGSQEDAIVIAEETEEEQEAREERERKEFMDAFRKARSEEDLLKEKLLSLDDKGEGSVRFAKNSGNLGRVFAGEGDVVGEEEIEETKKSALELLEEQKKGKELKAIDHSKQEYMPFRKNLYVVPRAVSRLTVEEVKSKRDVLNIVVRGKGCPAPVDTWEQCGVSDRMLQLLEKYNLVSPFAIQKQAMPAIMCGRDIIGVAKTGSGKTLAFVLPMIRHIQDQPPRKEGDGPIGIIMAPSRELALQISMESKKFTKSLGLRVASIYGGAAVAEQIADLKRGAEIVVCTPGRMIELLCMQAGKMISMKRVTMVVLDEADRMFDMGFEPQIKMIIQNIRPDRQTVLFSATFPKQIEKLAKSMLRFPLEIIVGERSSVNKDITQVIEVHEEEDKFLRLLQLLGIWYERGSTLIFVDKQEKCDQLYQDLLKAGYPCLSLHGGKDQLDRDHTLHQFKTNVFKIMIATSVAGRGLDVPEIVCVVNYHCPNHLEDYVHRIGRTGRAGRKGTAYTFISSKEDQYSPSMIKVLQKAGVDPPAELKAMAAQFKEKVERGEAQWSGSGFVGKGFKFDASEMNDTQRMASMQRKAYDVEMGIGDDDENFADDEDMMAGDDDEGDGPSSSIGTSSSIKGISSISAVPIITEGMTPIEKAQAIAAQIAMTKIPGVVGSVPSLSLGLKPVDSRVGLAKALSLVKQLVASKDSTSSSSSISHFADELEINDYPIQARRKLNQKKVMDEIIDRTGVNVISRGSYIPPGKKLEAGERKLYLLIEGETELSVKQARLELQRVLEEETMRLGVSGTMPMGRYSVI